MPPKCSAVWHDSDTLVIGEPMYPCRLNAGHEGLHEPEDESVPYTPYDPSVTLPSADDTTLANLTPQIAGRFALYPHGKTLYGVVHFDIPNDGKEIRGPVPQELVDILHGKKPTPLQLAKIAMTLLAA